MSEATHADVAIIGAGFGGLGAAIRLQRAGFYSFLIFEKANDVGGTWRDNSYPGCACDVPSHLYSYAFARNPRWSDTFSGQAEIWEYLRDCVDRFRIGPRLRLGHAVHQARWDETSLRWHLSTSNGAYTARVLISATGPLSEPAIPSIPGLGSFEGTVFHSARWQHDHDLTGRRVAVIGTGASAVQFVPAIQPSVGSLTLFQRTPAWVMPRRIRRITATERAIYEWVPGAQRAARTGLYWAREAMAVGFLHPPVNRFAQRYAERMLQRQVPDDALRAKLTPSYVMGCKRVLLSNDYWPSLTKENVEVVTEPIRELTQHGVLTADGREHEVDTLIFGTGFHVTDSPAMHRIVGRQGKTLADAWAPTMRSYLGTSVTGFPNLFLLLGPNTGLGHSSVVLMIEAQLVQVIAAMRSMRRRGIAAIEPTAQAQHRYNEKIDARMAGTVWMTGCRSWYLDTTGRNSTLWPGYVTNYRWRLRRFRTADYAVVERRIAAPVPAAAPVNAQEAHSHTNLSREGAPHVSPGREAAPRPVQAPVNFVRRGTGEPLVLIHGIGHRWQAWLPIMEELAAHHEVIALDLPGFGASPVPPGGMPSDMAQTVAGLVSFLAAEGLVQPHVAGNSLGGAIALELAVTGVARSATAFSPAGFFTAKERRRAMLILKSMRASSFLPAKVTRAALRSPTIRTICFSPLVAHPRRIDPLIAAQDTAAFRAGRGFTAVARASTTYRFHGVTAVPVTVAWGDRDRILRPHQAQRARDLLPQARHVIMPGCGHVPMIDDPALVAALIMQTTGVIQA